MANIARKSPKGERIARYLALLDEYKKSHKKNRA